MSAGASPRIGCPFGTAGSAAGAAVRSVNIGAISDVHLLRNDREEIRAFIDEVNRRADVLCVCGDMTTHGTPEQMRAFCDTLRDVDSPIVAVLGNHDCHSGAAAELGEILGERGIHLLDGTSVVIGGVGFAGVKGFGGGFGDHLLDPFGEEINKEYAGEAMNEAAKLSRALQELDTRYKVVLLHYSPIPETIRGEPAHVFPFMGTSRLSEPIEQYGVDVVFHGHAHQGQPRGRTPGGIPVFNVAFPVLCRAGIRCRVWTAH